MHTPRRAQWSPKASRQLLPDSRLANPRLARQRLARQRLTRHRLPWIRLPRQPLALRPRRPRLRLPASSGPNATPNTTASIPHFCRPLSPGPGPDYLRFFGPFRLRLFRPSSPGFSARPVPDSRPHRDRFRDRLPGRFLPGVSLRSSSLLGPMPPIHGTRLPPTPRPSPTAPQPPQYQFLRLKRQEVLPPTPAHQCHPPLRPAEPLPGHPGGTVQNACTYLDPNCPTDSIRSL